MSRPLRPCQDGAHLVGEVVAAVNELGAQRVGGIPRGLGVPVWPQQEEHEAVEQGRRADLPHRARQHGRGAEDIELGPAGDRVGCCEGCPETAPRHLTAGKKEVQARGTPRSRPQGGP